RRWIPAEAPDAQYASVFGASSRLFLASRQQHEVLVSDPKQNEWMSLALPSYNADVTTIAADPFREQRYYIGTQADGVWVFDGAMEKYVAKTVGAATALLTQQ